MANTAISNDVESGISNQPSHDDRPGDIPENMQTKRGRIFTYSKSLSPERTGRHALHNEYEYELMYPEIVSRRAVVDNPHNPTAHIHKARRYVLANVKGYRDYTDFLFLFSALFTTVITIFAVYTSHKPPPSYAEISKTILSELVQRHQVEHFSDLPPIDESSLDHALIMKALTTHQVINPWLRSLWSISIFLSLFAALVTVLKKYKRTFKPSGRARRMYRRLDEHDNRNYPTNRFERIAAQGRLLHQTPGESKDPTQRCRWED